MYEVDDVSLDGNVTVDGWQFINPYDDDGVEEYVFRRAGSCTHAAAKGSAQRRRSVVRPEAARRHAGVGHEAFSRSS